MEKTMKKYLAKEVVEKMFDAAVFEWVFFPLFLFAFQILQNRNNKFWFWQILSYKAILNF